MTGALILVLGFVVAVAVICGVLAAFIAHGYLWDHVPGSMAGAVVGSLGGAICAGLVFVMMWTLNPDPPRDNGGRPTVGATLTLTGFSGMLWGPLYLYAFAAMARRRRHASGPDAPRD